MKKIMIINGVNLNMLGKRDPEAYGKLSYADLKTHCQERASTLSLEIDIRQSNIEGEIISWCQELYDDSWGGLVLNAGAHTHTSIALYDVLIDLHIPKIEVHISNVYRREEFRHKSYVSPVVDGVICGLGVQGYGYALEHIKLQITNNQRNN